MKSIAIGQIELSMNESVGERAPLVGAADPVIEGSWLFVIQLLPSLLQLRKTLIPPARSEDKAPAQADSQYPDTGDNDRLGRVLGVGPSDRRGRSHQGDNRADKRKPFRLTHSRNSACFVDIEYA